MSEERVFNELGNASCGVWCRLRPGIDPGDWSSLCRSLGRLRAEEFARIYSKRHRAKLRRAVTRFLADLLAYDADVPPGTPVVSRGPSGLGGVYQKEIRVPSGRRSPLGDPSQNDRSV